MTEETVVEFPAPKTASRVLAEAAGAQLKTVVVIGFTKDGEFYTHCLAPDGADVLWLLEKAKQMVLEAGR